MSAVVERSDFDWLNRRSYPFAPHYLQAEGGRLHYVDEGEGEPILFLHGRDTWSYLFRTAIRQFSTSGYRCVAPDHLGFGLSEKPANWSYAPAAHARNVAALIEHLDLRDITLVCHDLGGPIGLGYLAEHPDRIKRVVLMNTWMSCLDKDPAAQKIAKMASGALGKFLYLNNCAGPKAIKGQFVDRDKYTNELHAAYFGPFQNKEARVSTLESAKHLAESRPWYNEIWASRELFGAKNLMLLWGLKDPTFGEKALNRIWHEFPLAEVKTFADAGHFLMEEKPRETIAAIREHLIGAAKGVGFLA